MIFAAYDPAATPDALANRELDLYRIGPNVDLLRRGQQTPGVAVRSAPSRLYTQVSFNGAPGAALSDPALRRALAQSPTYRDIATAIAHQLAGTGVTAELRQYPSNEIFPAVTSGNVDLALFSWYATASPVSSATEIYGSPLGANARQNYGRVASPEIDTALAAGNAELDDGRRAAIGNQIDRLIWAEAHSVMLFAWPGAVAVRAELANFGASGFADPNYVDAGFLR